VFRPNGCDWVLKFRSIRVFEPFLVIVLIGLRAVGVILAMPSPGGGTMPAFLRGAMGILIAVLLWGVVGVPSALAGRTWGFYATSAVSELLLGLVMGFIVRVAFSISAFGGRLISNEIGLNSPPGFDVPLPAQEPLPSLLTAFSGVLFFNFGLHHDVLSSFARSFEVSPLGSYSISGAVIERLIRTSAEIFVVGLRIAAPFIALSFVTNLAFGLMGRAVPRMNVFVESISLRLWAGLLLLSGSGALIWRNLDPHWQRVPWTILEVCFSPSRP
jgi:flagellar biosynthesis protein FliR